MLDDLDRPRAAADVQIGSSLTRGDVRAVALAAMGVASAASAAAPVAGPAIMVGTCLAMLGTAVGLLSAPRLAFAVRVLVNRRRARRALRDSGSVGPIADAPDGLVRVRGTVRLLRTVTAPSGEAVAAYRWDVPDTLACGCRERCEHVLDYRRIESRAGRFAVVDSTGVAVVDDDFFVVCRSEPGRDPGDGLLLQDGDQVEVVGPAHRGDAPDVAPLMMAGYRDRASRALVFDGRAESPVIALV